MTPPMAGASARATRPQSQEVGLSWPGRSFSLVRPARTSSTWWSQTVRRANWCITPIRPGASQLSLVSSLALPARGAVGMALEPGTLPSRLAITFAGGQVALAQIQAGFGMSLLTSRSVPTRIRGAPYWCQCPGGDLIGVGGRNGGLYLFDTSLNPNATYPAGGPSISTAPAADSAGDWFFGGSDGAVYEMQRQTGQTTMALRATFGSAGGPISSSPIVGTCQTSWICVYIGSTDSHAYVVPLDARHAVITACISTAPPACSGTNPRLWATVEVGSASSPNTVHVGGWSYYSP